MKELDDLAKHQFYTKTPTQSPNYIQFSAPLLGQGILGCYSPNKDISILYLSCKPVDDFIWINNKEWKKDDMFFFNYFLKSPVNLFTITNEKVFEKLNANKMLLVDGTTEAEKSLVMVKNEHFELFQLSISNQMLVSHVNEFLQGFSEEIKDFCFRKSVDRSQVSVYLPIQSKEELCIRKIINCPFGMQLQSQYTILKVTELIIYYLHRMVNGGVMSQTPLDTVSIEAKNTMLHVKSYIENCGAKELDYAKLTEMSNMKFDKTNQLFIAVFGQSIAKYFRKVKLQQAYNLLLDLDKGMNVSEVAFEMGFSTVSSFSRAFFNEFNIRPSSLKLEHNKS